MRARAPLGTLAWVALVGALGIPLAALAVQAATTGWFFPDLVPDQWTTDGISDVTSSGATLRALRDSLLVSLTVTVVSLALAVPAARALAFGPPRRRALLAALFALPVALPPLALGMGLEVAFLRTGVSWGPAAVVIAHLAATLPYAVLLLTAALRRYEVGFELQALGLGVRPGAVLRRVFLPLALPALAVTSALTFIVSWSQYLLTFLPGGGRVVTMPVLVLGSVGGGNPTTAAALALAAALPPMVAVLAVVRHLDRPLETRR